MGLGRIYKWRGRYYEKEKQKKKQNEKENRQTDREKKEMSWE